MGHSGIWPLPACMRPTAPEHSSREVVHVCTCMQLIMHVCMHGCMYVYKVYHTSEYIRTHNVVREKIDR